METDDYKSNIENTIAIQREFFEKGKTRSAEYKIWHLKMLYKSITQHEYDIANALYKDLHKSEYEAYITEIGLVKSEIKQQIKLCKKYAKPRRVCPTLFVVNAKSQIYYEPYGLTLIVTPWNYPFQLALMPLVGAIAAGNCVVLKLSPDSSHTNKVIKQILEEVFNPEYVSVFEGHRDVNTLLFAQPFDHIFLTGSPELGKIAMEAAAKHLAKVTLELGGKSPCIIDKDANIEIATKRVAFGKVVNSGQTCIAPDYIFVHKDVKHKFIEQFKETISTFYGKDIQHNPEYPHIVSDKAMHRLVNLLSCGDVIYGGTYDKESRFFHPTLIENVSPDSELMQNEIFGPIFPIYTFEDIDEVIGFINSRKKPLALYYFTENKNLAEKMVRDTSSGGVCINDTLMHIVNHNLPFGGVQNSGLGNYHGEFSYSTFSHQKAVLRTSTTIDFFIKYPPFGKNRTKWIKKIF